MSKTKKRVAVPNWTTVYETLPLCTRCGGASHEPACHEQARTFNGVIDGKPYDSLMIYCVICRECRQVRTGRRFERRDDRRDAKFTKSVHCDRFRRVARETEWKNLLHGDDDWPLC